MHSHCKLVSREVGGCWGVETGVAATPWWRSIETGTVSAPRAGSREHQGKREHWPVMATKYAYLGLHPYWVDSWGACAYRISCTGNPAAHRGRRAAASCVTQPGPRALVLYSITAPG